MMKAREWKTGRNNCLLEGLLRPLWQRSCWWQINPWSLTLSHCSLQGSSEWDSQALPVSSLSPYLSPLSFCNPSLSSSSLAISISSSFSLLISLLWNFQVDIVFLQMRILVESVRFPASSSESPQGLVYKSTCSRQMNFWINDEQNPEILSVLQNTCN